MQTNKRRSIDMNKKETPSSKNSIMWMSYNKQKTKNNGSMKKLKSINT